MSIVLAPRDEAETAAMVRSATMPLEITGNGSKRALGRPVVAEMRLDIRALSKILRYEPEELVLTALAGTPLSEILAVLTESRQMLGFEPADFGPLLGAPSDQASLGGIVATNACGSRRLKAGAVRDHVIGCRFVNGLGETIRAGGRVIKNVTGFDIPKLMCGAFGTLGVLIELTVRLMPRPQQVAALALSCAPKEGLSLLRDAVRQPVDPSGLAYLPASALSREIWKTALPGEGVAVIRIEGGEVALRDKLDKLQDHFRALEAVVLDHDATSALFRFLSDGGPFVARQTDLWRLCVAPSDASAALEASGASRWYADWGGGLLWLELPATVEMAARLRAITKMLGGHATLMRASEQARTELDVFEPEPPQRTNLTRAVKAAFDPRSFINPGRMFKGV